MTNNIAGFTYYRPGYAAVEMPVEQMEALFEASRHIHVELPFWNKRTIEAWNKGRQKLMAAIAKAEQSEAS